MSSNLPAAPTSLQSQSMITGAWAPYLVINEQVEHVPQLVWPASVATYHQMRSDSQVSGLMFGLLGPLLRRNWRVDPNGAPSSVYRPIAEQLGLDVKGEEPRPRGRAAKRFSFGMHMYHALLACQYGHMYFEQLGEYRQVGDRERWMLTKLVPIMPHTIADIGTESDGGLKYVQQNIGYRPPKLDVSRLVAYVWAKEGASWTGRSMLRPMYRHWLRKDRLMRVDAVKHERHGMGIPWFQAPPGATPAQINALALAAQKLKAGAESGGAGPYGSKLELIGVTGNIPDTLASIRYDDEAMARSVSMMIVQLGTTEHGSRALGDSFDDLLDLAQDVIADWFVDIFNEHVLEDWVDWGWDQDTPAPLLTYQGDDEEETDISSAELRELIDAGVIEVDEELEEWIRQRENLPKKGEPRTKPIPPALQPFADPNAEPDEEGTEKAQEARRLGRRYRRTPASRKALRAASKMLPTRELPRAPYAHELKAAVDYAALDEQFDSLLGQVVDDWKAVQAEQIDELVAQVRASSTVVSLSQITVSPIGADVLHRHMATMAEEGMRAAVEEARRQGMDLDMPDALDERVNAQLRSRADAVDNLMARSLAEAGSRQAVQRYGGSLTPDEIAAEVRQHLEGLSDQYLEDQFGGTLQASLNSGRAAVFERIDDEATFYASELLDANTCKTCAEIDGTEYPGLEAAQEDYPTGGYKGCLGGPRCRGIFVAVLDEDGDEI